MGPWLLSRLHSHAMSIVPQQAGLEEAPQMSAGGAPVNTTAIIFGGNSAVFAEPLENTTARLEQFSLQERLKWMMQQIMPRASGAAMANSRGSARKPQP